MALLEIYQGDTKTLALQFVNDDGSTLNASGYVARYIAKRSYVETGLLINEAVTGGAGAVTGNLNLTLTSGDTNQCPGDYLAVIKLYDLSSGVTTFNTDGLRILPNLFVG